MNGWAGCVASALLLLSVACEQRLAYGSLRADVVPPDGSTPDATFAEGDAGAGCTPEPPLPSAVCDGPGSARFQYGLCSCADVQSSGSLLLDGFDSQLSAYTPGPGGSLAANGSFYPGAAQIGGSLIVAGTNGAPIAGDLSVGEDLSSAGQLDGPFGVSVGGDAFVMGNLHVQRLTVGGQLHVAAASSVEVAEGSPAFLRDAVAPAQPCDCTPARDVQALLAAARADNDNLAIDLAPDTGLKALAAPLELTLPCGRYFVDEVYAAHPITITVTGRVELHVAGGVVADSAGTLEIQLAPGGELDLFVGGGLAAQNHVSIGSRAAPGRTRIHGAAGQTFFFGGETVLSALLDAPESSLVTAGSFEVFGALLVQSSSSSASVRLHHDRSLTRCER